MATTWNDYPQIKDEINRRVSGDPAVSWQEHFQRSMGGRKFRKALILNCGNGWVERELYESGLFEEAVGVDIGEDLLIEAREKAAGLPLHYAQMDINTGTFPADDFDLVVNHAAAHHMAYLDKIFRSINRVMTADGVFVNYDYVGPHRNQYPFAQWEAAYEANLRLPAGFRQDMQYPHLPTMLVTDPSEAIHSELILPVMRRYFTIEGYRPTGGALAYLLLTHNAKAQGMPPAEADPLIRQIIAEDTTYLEAHPESTLFAYWVARPKIIKQDSDPALQAYTAEEIERETAAIRNWGLYYPLSLIQMLYIELEHCKLQVRQLSDTQ